MAEKRDWKVLQKRVFTRWLNSKLVPRKIRLKEEELLTSWGRGFELVALLEVLSQKTCANTKKMRADPKMRIQFIENINWSLQFLTECEVKLELKPSAENLLDGEERQIMGMIWGIMRTFLNVGDDPRLNAEKALKLWVRNTTKPYGNVNVQDFGKSWHDGYALCGLIHAYNPKLIGKWEDLDKLTNLERIKLAMDAAEKFFGLEQYLAPDEIEILDDKSMIIYISEYYYGLTKHGKVRTAASRIRGLIEESKINDQLKDDYNRRAKELRDALEAAKTQIGDGNGDGTLEGAEKKIKEFYELRDKTRGPLLQDFLGLETLYNTLTMRLSDQKRPEFKCDAGCSLPELRGSLSGLEVSFKDLEKILLAELRRQRQIAKLNSQHEERCNKIKEWGAGKQQLLESEIEVPNTGRARFLQNQLNTLNKEVNTVNQTSVVEIKKLGAKLIELKYERADDVLAREAEVDALFPSLAALAAKRAAALADALAREEYKEATKIRELSHADKSQKLSALVAQLVAVLEQLAQSAPTLEGVDSVNFSISQLATVEEDVSAAQKDLDSLKALGQQVATAEFKGELSSWRFESQDALAAKEAKVEEAFAKIAPAQEAAKAGLDDALAREKFKQQVRLWERTHQDNSRKLAAELAAIRAFLEQKMDVDSIQAAAWALRQLKNNASERQSKQAQLQSLKAVGAKLAGATFGSWHFDAAPALAREADLEKELSALDELAQQQAVAYEAALGNEQNNDQKRIAWANEANDFKRWAKDQTESINGTLFGSTLEEVEAFDIKSTDQAVREDLAARQTSYRAVDDALKSVSGGGTSYSSATVAELDAAGQAVETCLAVRGERYEAEMSKRKSEENLCQQFAALANPLMDKINHSKDLISNPAGSLEEQLAYISSTRAEEEPKAGSYFAPIDDKQKELDAAGITSNPHCLYTASDLHATWNQYLAFIQTKEKMLSEKIEHDKLKGLTPEQWQNIGDTWTRFDKDKSGFLDQKEFKDCLFSLGESKEDAEIEKLMNEHGDGKQISRAGFENFMISQLGNVKSKAAIEESFVVLTNGEPVASLEQLLEQFTEEEVAYIKTKAPKREDGQIDWRAWVEKEYS